MPKMDGVSVLHEIMSSEHEAKIIMITADENFNTIYKSTAEGAQAYIIKPFSFTDVLNAITMVLN
jgi:two-component system chemotaxis response regulator CheY